MAPVGLFGFCFLFACFVKLKKGNLICTETASFVALMVKTLTTVISWTILHLLKYAQLQPHFLYLYFQLDFSRRLLTTSDPREFSFPDKTDASPDGEYCSVLSNVGLAGDKVEGP